MAIYPYRDSWPQLGQRTFVAPSADVIGDVVIGDDSSIWFQSVVRGDMHRIRIGSRTNVQDGSVLHVTYRTHPLEIGDGVVVGHGAIVHGCTLEDGVLVGMGAQVLDGAVVETGAQIGAGAVVVPGQRIPSGQLALGVPAKVVRPLAPEDRRRIVDFRDRYVALKDEYLAMMSRPLGSDSQVADSSLRPEERGSP